MKNSETLDSLENWLVRLETLSSIEINLGLERVDVVLKRLNLKKFEYVISIAGTNGKGSTAAILSALLKEMSFCVGSYTSPHLHKYNERININGISVSDEQIIQAFKRVESKRQTEPLTYFEYGPLAALSIFVLLEKVVPIGLWIGRASGIVFVIWGSLLLFNVIEI